MIFLQVFCEGFDQKYRVFVEHYLMTNSGNIEIFNIVYYICRHYFSCFVFNWYNWYWRNEKSWNSTRVKEKLIKLIKEKHDKKEGCFNWLFQTLKSTKTVVVSSATKFPRALWNDLNCFLLSIVKIKTNLN